MLCVYRVDAVGRARQELAARENWLCRFPEVIQKSRSLETQKKHMKETQEAGEEPGRY